eukprot:844924-Prorocentrum_minimum.AAC.3
MSNKCQHTFRGLFFCKGRRPPWSRTAGWGGARCVRTCLAVSPLPPTRPVCVFLRGWGIFLFWSGGSITRRGGFRRARWSLGALLWCYVLHSNPPRDGEEEILNKLSTNIIVSAHHLPGLRPSLTLSSHSALMRCPMDRQTLFGGGKKVQDL